MVGSESVGDVRSTKCAQYGQMSPTRCIFGLIHLLAPFICDSWVGVGGAGVRSQAFRAMNGPLDSFAAPSTTTRVGSAKR